MKKDVIEVLFQVILVLIIGGAISFLFMALLDSTPKWQNLNKHIQVFISTGVGVLSFYLGLMIVTEIKNSL